MESQYATEDGSIFNIFDHINGALLKEETRETWTSKEPRVWPSAASVEYFDQVQNKIGGKCHRATYLSMIGTVPSRALDANGAWIFLFGRMIETAMTGYTQKTYKDRGSIHIASGLRMLVAEVLLSGEIDLFVLNPVTFQGTIVEQKTFSSKNYQKAKQILKEGKPNVENLLQIAIYLLEIQTGANLKVMVSNQLALQKLERAKYEESIARGGNPLPLRNRLEVTPKNLEAMDDGPLAAKLAYLDKATGATKEMNITIEKDEIDDLTYPVVDGQVWKLFPLESIYARYKTLQQYFYNARMEAETRLFDRKINPPASIEHILMPTWEVKNAFYETEKAYQELLGREMRALGPAFWPPAEYDVDYSAEKVEKLWTLGLVAKTRYEGWKKKHKGKEIIGDSQCTWCDHGLTCLRVEKPLIAHLLNDLADAEEGS